MECSALVMKPPSVAIVITNYNYKQYIAAAIASVAEQTYPNLECVVVDDCSTDGSFDAINQELDRRGDARFRSIRLAQNLGQMGAIKAGVENTNGPFIVFLDADDALMPRFVEKHLETHLNGSYSAGISASDTVQIDDDDQILEGTFHTLMKRRTTVRDNPIKPIDPDALADVSDGVRMRSTRPKWNYHYIEASVRGWHFAAMSSMMFRRSVIEMILPDDPTEIRICADYYLATFAHMVTGTLTIGERLSYYRLHRQNSFSVHPVLGGRYHPGVFTQDVRLFIERRIAEHAARHVSSIGSMIGLEPVRRIIRTLVSRKDIHSLLKPYPDARLVLGSPWKFFWKYRAFYRALGRH
jgi:glycosyltransferase involved in cell wall biosynthesis